MVEHVQGSPPAGAHFTLIAGISLAGCDFRHKPIADMHIDAAAIAAHTAQGLDDAVVSQGLIRHQSLSF
jgi:hypothetical protein